MHTDIAARVDAWLQAAEALLADPAAGSGGGAAGDTDPPVPLGKLWVRFRKEHDLELHVRTGWVFGTEVPRLMINEAYAEVANTPGDNGATAKQPFQVNFWVELHNPMKDDSTLSGYTDTTVRLSTNSGANLAYRILLTDPRMVRAFEWIRSYALRLGKDSLSDFRSGFGTFS